MLDDVCLCLSFFPNSLDVDLLIARDLFQKQDILFIYQGFLTAEDFSGEGGAHITLWWAVLLALVREKVPQSWNIRNLGRELLWGDVACLVLWSLSKNWILWLLRPIDVNLFFLLGIVNLFVLIGLGILLWLGILSLLFLLHLSPSSSAFFSANASSSSLLINFHFNYEIK